MQMNSLNEPSNDDDDTMEDNFENDQEEDDTDLNEEELLALNAEMDAINSALDSLEQRNDQINTQLRTILKENAEAKREIEEENQMTASEGEKKEGKRPMGYEENRKNKDLVKMKLDAQ